jgi:hypothetical protein
MQHHFAKIFSTVFVSSRRDRACPVRLFLFLLLLLMKPPALLGDAVSSSTSSFVVSVAVRRGDPWVARAVVAVVVFLAVAVSRVAASDNSHAAPARGPRRTASNFSFSSSQPQRGD